MKLKSIVLIVKLTREFEKKNKWISSLSKGLGLGLGLELGLSGTIKEAEFIKECSSLHGLNNNLSLLILFLLGFKEEFLGKNYVEAIKWYELVLKLSCRFCSESDPAAAMTGTIINAPAIHRTSDDGKIYESFDGSKNTNGMNCLESVDRLNESIHSLLKYKHNCKCTMANVKYGESDSNAFLMARARLAFLYSHSRPGTVLNIAAANRHKWYLKNYYMQRGESRPRDWLQMAAEMGIREAAYCIALNHYNGIGYSHSNPTLAFHWAHKAATKGLALAQNLLGNMYIEGSAPDGKNPDLAMNWYIQAGEQREPTAVYNIGTLFERGEGVTQNLLEAIQWFERAAKLQSVNAHAVLGILHHRGLVPAAHPTLAFYHYKQAALQGHPESLYNLGRCFQDGFGCEKDSRKAYFCFLAAAEQYHSKSILSVAICHEFGLGIQKNMNEAVEWYIKAVEYGQDEARLRLIPVFTKRIVNAAKAILYPHSIPSLRNDQTSSNQLGKPNIYLLPREIQLKIIETLNKPKILQFDEMSELMEGILDDLKNGADNTYIHIQEMENAIKRVLAKACSCPTEHCDRLVHILFGFENLEYCS